MSLSSVCVVTNALRLRRFRPNCKLNFNENKNTKILDINSKMQNYSTSQEEASILNINAFASIEKTEAAKTIYHEVSL